MTEQPSGLTKREYFAAMAMQGILANSASVGKFTVQDATGAAVRWAEALIAELNKEPKP